MEDRPDYFIRGTVTLEDSRVENVLCKLYLPKRSTEQPLMVFQLDEEQYEHLSGRFKGGFSGTQKNRENEDTATFRATSVIFKNVSRSYWGKDISDFHFDGEPEDLIIEEKVGSNGNKDTSIVFYLTDIHNLSLFGHIRETSFDGSIKIVPGPKVVVPILEKAELSFSEHFSYKEDKKRRKLVQWGCNVAELTVSQINVDSDEIKDTIMPLVDDLLLIVSFATRTRIACIRWTAYGNGKRLSSYRGNISIPRNEKRMSELVKREHQREYWPFAFNEFVKSPYKDMIRKAVYALVPGIDRALEEEFLSMFAGLEAVLLCYRRQHNMEVVFPLDEWKQKKRVLQKEIGKILEILGSDPEQRNRMYQKLDELNRISLKSVWKHFCEDQQVDISDLWPLFRKEDVIGLSEIRNWLIHNGPIPEEGFGALMGANENLRWILERVVCSLLYWPLERTTINFKDLQKYDAIFRDMPCDQKKLSELLVYEIG